MRIVPLLAAIATGLVYPATALANVKGPHEGTPLNLPSTQSHIGSAAGGGSLTRTFIGLIVVVAVIYGLYWVLKQVKRSREERATGTGLRTEAIVPLGPNRSLHLVRAGRELVLLGVAEQGVVPIRTYTEAEAEAAGLMAPATDVVDVEAAPPRQLPARTGAGAPLAQLLSGRAGEALSNLRQMTVRG